MEEILLKAEPRQIVGKQVKALRREGRLPAVLYGVGNQPTPISLDLHSTTMTLSRITSSHLLTIDVNGQRHPALVREKQRHPVRGTLIHIDFLEVSMTEKLRTQVVVVLEGESPAVKNYDGVIVQQIESLEVECLPRDLPERIMVDLSSLDEIGSALYIRDLNVPSAVEILEDPDEIVVVVTAQAAEEVEEVVPETVEPEVLERGKKEEEE